MNLPPTGFLDFAWPSGTGVEAYSFKAYKNNAFYDNFYTTHTGIRVSGLIEGDAMYGYVYPYINGNISSSFQIVEEQTVPVAWFDETFSFNFISVDQNNISLSDNFGESSYTEGQAFINFDLINPRTSGVITGFDSDPLLSSVVYESRYSDNTLIESFNLNNNSFISRNSLKSFRQYMASIIVEDYHGRLITGDIELSNSPIQINSIDYQFVSGNDTTQELLFHSDYSASCIKVDYFTYDSNELTGQYLSSGESHTPSNYSMSIDNGFSGAILIIPYDWFGAGDDYLIKDFSLAEQVETEYINDIDYLNLDDGDYGSFTISSDYISHHNSGSYFHLSINDSTGSHFTESALYTGAFNDLSSGIEFNYFNTLTTSDTGNLAKLYHINVQLYQSGSQELEDERSVSGSYDIPHFYDSDIAFDYALGVTTTSFDVSSTLDFTGISVLYSGKDATGYSPAVDYSLETGSIEATTTLKLVHANDSNFVFDELYISGSGQSMSPNISMGQFATADALFPVYITNNNPGVAINQLHKYGRFSFKDTSVGQDVLPDSYSGILNFEDFTGHALGFHFLGSSFLPAPTGLARNQEYSIEGTDCIYESGLHYMYRFVPENGYGTGEPSDVLYAEFPLNNFTKYLDGNQVSLSSSVSDLETAVSQGGINTEDFIFKNLNDTPSEYEDGSILQSTSIGVSYVDPQTLLTGITFTGLSDAPSVYESGYYIQSNETGIDYISASGLADNISTYLTGFMTITGFSGTTGATKFTGLDDVPSYYSSGSFLQSNETGISYVDITGMSSALIEASILDDHYLHSGVLLNNQAQGIVINTGQLISYNLFSGNKLVIDNNAQDNNIYIDVTGTSRNSIKVYDFDLYVYNLYKESPFSTNITNAGITLTAENTPVTNIKSGEFAYGYNCINIKLMNLQNQWISMYSYI